MTKKYKISLIFITFVFIGVFIYKKYVLRIPSVQEAVNVGANQNETNEPVKQIEDLVYTSVILSSDTPGKELTELIGSENLSSVLSLNRIDQKHFQKDMVIVYPSRYDDLFSLSSFPRFIPELSQTPKILFISQKIQEFGAYEYGNLVRFGGISTGKKSTATPNGLFYTNWKGKEVISTANDEWILKWNFNIDNLNGIGIHEYELPGYPASHSCIRLSASDAEWFYNWALQWKLSKDGSTVLEKGTPVILFGEFDYTQTAPWKRLAEDPYIMTISNQDIQKELSTFLSS